MSFWLKSRNHDILRFWMYLLLVFASGFSFQMKCVVFWCFRSWCWQWWWKVFIHWSLYFHNVYAHVCQDCACWIVIHGRHVTWAYSLLDSGLLIIYYLFSWVQLTPTCELDQDAKLELCLKYLQSLPRAQVESRSTDISIVFDLLRGMREVLETDLTVSSLCTKIYQCVWFKRFLVVVWRVFDPISCTFVHQYNLFRNLEWIHVLENTYYVYSKYSAIW